MHTKNAQRHKKTQARYENSTTKLVLKRCQTFAENITFILFRQVKTQFSLSQKNSLVMETHLTDALLWKTGIPESSYGCGCFKFIIVSHSSIRAAEDRIGPCRGNLNCLSENILSSLLHHKRFITITQPSYKTSSPLELFFNWISHIKSYDSPCQMEWIP